MEVLRDNFHAELPYIKEAIDECEFIAIDAEFSGTDLWIKYTPIRVLGGRGIHLI